MSDKPDIYISNGTCYSAPSLKAGGAMIPCGNDYFGHIACCQAGDYCLESNTCFNGEYGVTYISGCTDSHYEDESCPPKFDDWDTPWLGMSYCNDTSDEWAACDQTAHPTTLTSPDPCSCPTVTSDRSMLISQSSIIPQVGLLPPTLGESIDFILGHYPTARDPTTTAGTVAFGSSIPSSSTILSPTPVETSVPLPEANDRSNPQGFSNAAKVGTSVGAAAFSLLALTALGYILLRRRRRRRRQKRTQQKQDDDATQAFMNGGDEGKPPSGNAVGPHGTGLAVSGPPGDEVSRSSNPDITSTISELGTKAARPWSMRSELDSNTSVRSSSVGPAGTEGQGHGRYVRTGPSELASQPLAELPG